jgi:ribonuclease HII
MLLSCYQEDLTEVGCDEAGRGCLAGPVFAAAVILPRHVKIPMLNDSKKLSKRQRNILRPIIEEKALSWAVALVNESKIDEINILNASILAMHLALESLDEKPEFIVVDGNRFKPYPNIPHQTIIKGDGKYMNIAAASVLAKTHRDEWMEKIHHEFENFNWKQNKGYPTLAHRMAIEQHGLTRYHRKSFNVKSTQSAK